MGSGPGGSKTIRGTELPSHYRALMICRGPDRDHVWNVYEFAVQPELQVGTVFGRRPRRPGGTWQWAWQACAGPEVPVGSLAECVDRVAQAHPLPPAQRPKGVVQTLVENASGGWDRESCMVRLFGDVLREEMNAPGET
jgi:hypothetical protein